MIYILDVPVSACVCVCVLATEDHSSSEAQAAGPAAWPYADDLEVCITADNCTAGIRWLARDLLQYMFMCVCVCSRASMDSWLAKDRVEGGMEWGVTYEWAKG